MANEIDPKVELEKLEAKKVADALAKLPSIEELEGRLNEIESQKREISRLKNLKYNFGPGKKGKKPFDLPVMPKSLGDISVNGRKLQGKTLLDHGEWQEYLYHYSNRLELEDKMRNGESVSQKELKQLQNTSKGLVNISRTGETRSF